MAKIWIFGERLNGKFRSLSGKKYRIGVTGTSDWYRDADVMTGTSDWYRDADIMTGTSNWYRDADMMTGTSDWYRDANIEESLKALYSKASG